MMIPSSPGFLYDGFSTGSRQKLILTLYNHEVSYITIVYYYQVSNSKFNFNILQSRVSNSKEEFLQTYSSYKLEV